MRKLLENMRILVALGIGFAVIVAVITILASIKPESEQPAEVDTTSALEKIVQIDELSTFSVVYHGVAEVVNEKKPEKIDYYVSYDANVKAGLNTEDIKISIDDNAKKIIIVLPDVHITKAPIVLDSLDFIFLNDKADAAGVTQKALLACEKDLEEELKANTEIYKLAWENAEQTIRAIIEPLIEQLDENYEIEIR